ncbi:unnamed protein product [Laminaria digitata]
MLKLLMRALALVSVWLPVAVSGLTVDLLERLPVFPEQVSAHLRGMWWTVLLKAIDLCGPTFIKAAQWASTRQDIFSQDVCKALGKLHTFTTWRPIRYGEDALDAAFGPSWRQSFELEDEALGSGCVAQVYKGRFLAGEYTGDPVAVKVVDPSLKSTVGLDLSLMRGAATLLELLPRLHWLSICETVNEFGQLMESQLDLRKEASNLERFRRDFADDPSLVVPRPLYPWVTGNVLVEEFKEGKPISTYFGGDETRQLARMGLQAFLKMVFVHNFVHGDLHPGNLMVGRREDNGGPRLVMLDAGIVCELDQHDRKNFIDLFYAVVVGDGKQAGRLMIERARDQQCTDPEGFCRGVDALVQKARSRGLRLGQIQAGQLLTTMFALCVKHEVKLESKFTSVVIAIAVLEGVGRSLDPDCNILQASLPVVAKAGAMYME